MIKDKICNFNIYVNAHPLFETAFKWLKENAVPDIADGRIEISEDRIIALPQHYHTHPFESAKFEVHKKYIDIQYVVSGNEYIYIGEPESMTTVTPFNTEKDIAFFNGSGNAVRLNPGDFMIIWPHEAHEPCVNTDENSSYVHKIIMKIAVK